MQNVLVIKRHLYDKVGIKKNLKVLNKRRLVNFTALLAIVWIVCELFNAFMFAAIVGISSPIKNISNISIQTPCKAQGNSIYWLSIGLSFKFL